MRQRVTVRIEKIVIENFKNIIHGEVNMNNFKNPYSASILGVYGQNGSGKTALIDSLALLKSILCGEIVAEKYIELINVSAEFSEFKFILSAKDDFANNKYEMEYSFKLGKTENIINNKTDGTETKKFRPVIFDELLSASFYDSSNGNNYKMHPIVDARKENTKKEDTVFSPETKYISLVGDYPKLDMLLSKARAYETSRSFVFSRELLSVITEKCEENWLKNIFCILSDYGHRDLFVVDTAASGLISLGNLPLNIMYSGDDMEMSGSLLLMLNEPTIVPKELVPPVEKAIDGMNIVLEQIVPGMKMGFLNLGAEAFGDGRIGQRIQLVSYKNEKQIPLSNESEGIKRIISVLQLLIVMYNNSSITVAIDELDSGIFEYLLGELLRIVSQEGKGQLIFTSHNLRPLETLDKRFIAFSTTNPRNRFIRVKNVKSTNNLRDFYFRDIMIDGQDECLYEPTNNSYISLAMKKAGGLLA